MDVYGQDAELRLLTKLLARLDRRTMLDIGAEQGSLAMEMLHAGVETLYAFDPHPDNVSALRKRFKGDPRVTVYEHAISDGDGSAELHVSSNPDGTPLPFGHTLLAREDTHEIAWRQTVSVTCRSLQSLMDADEIPASVGILKIDTEGHDLAVVHGMGMLEADVVMVEHWADLPAGLGTCPWTTQEMVGALRARGFTHFAFIVHRGEFVTIKWDDGDVESGAMGNLVFLHDRVLGALLPDILDCAGWLAEQAVGAGQAYMRAANDRSGLVADLKQAADDRLALLNAATYAAEERLSAVEIIKAELRERNAELDALRRERIDDRA